MEMLMTFAFLGSCFWKGACRLAVGEHSYLTLTLNHESVLAVLGTKPLHLTADPFNICTLTAVLLLLLSFPKKPPWIPESLEN